MPSQSAVPTLDRPIFVVGHPRSGTTLLASMLGRHPDIASTPESLYLTHVRYLIDGALPSGGAAVAEALLRTAARHLVDDPLRLTAALKALPPPLTHRKVFTTLLEQYRAVRGAPRVLEKSPWHLRHVEELLGWYPDARILWIVRDGRACVASLQKVPWATHDPTSLARQWVRNMTFGLTAERRAGGSLRRVRYEALLADPDSEMRAIQAFIGVEPSDAVHDHTRQVDTIKPSEVVWKQNVNRPLIAGRTEAWREELSADALARVSAIANPMLERLGYPTEPVPAGMARYAAVQRLRSSVLYSPPAIEAMRLIRPLTMRARRGPAARGAAV